MRLAIALGRRGLGRVWPNPAVGCVLVRAGRIVGRGWTAPGGRPHAETLALAQAGTQARGATAYVSLEPCAHHGRTPPCAQALIEAGVARVVTALTDPDPRVDGGGHAMLRAAGIAVTEGVEAAAARAANAGFVSRLVRGRPWLTLKLALTLDGRIATASGESRWITGGAARRAVHAMRATHDAVLVGAGTARADDPDLRVRDLGTGWQPVRLVADSRLRLPVGGRLGASAGAAPVWMLHGRDAPPEARAAWAAAGAEVIMVPDAPAGGLDPAAMLRALGEKGLTRVLCEGGGLLAASLLRAGLVDELAVFSAGRLIGAEGRSGMGPLRLAALAEAPHFHLIDTRPVGADLLHIWRRDP
ncbi:MAG: bifunctional diaminohydroxyphosphoribosylaminopyrimidine deaminase/5-amino-6-(5-phosphoribosylamino)uracil reductase RibD [Rhodobacteraceae bacterium]|nr:bifunctional diaminohydroxyphosphoribosylaminopyrimidine deaminase/5-amino-6-(5-phosphoribosylamino)uracil reductase RibD [Paracoccaceae bacterium]